MGVKGEIVHRQLVKTAECQEHERIIRRIEEAPKLVKEDTEPEEGEVCSSEMPSDEEKEEEDEERKERLEAVADAKSKLDLIRSELERIVKKKDDEPRSPKHGDCDSGKEERRVQRTEEDDEVYGPRPPPATRKSEERSSRSSRRAAQTSRTLSEQSEERTSSSKKQQRSGSTKVDKEEDKQRVGKEGLKGSDDDPAPIMNALQ